MLRDHAGIGGILDEAAGEKETVHAIAGDMRFRAIERRYRAAPPFRRLKPACRR